MTRLHSIENISTKFHEDTTTTYEVMAQTRHKLHIFDLWPLSVTLTFDIVMGFVLDTSTQHGEHFHKVSWKYNNNLWSYGQKPDLYKLEDCFWQKNRCFWHKNRCLPHYNVCPSSATLTLLKIINPEQDNDLHN